MRLRTAIFGLLAMGGGLTASAQTHARLALPAPLLTAELRSPSQPLVRPAQIPEVLPAGMSAIVSRQRSPFSSETRVPVVTFLGGRFSVEGFKQQVATERLLRGLPDKVLVKQLDEGKLRPRGESLYGLRISFQLDHTAAIASPHLGSRIKNLLASF